VLTEKKISDAQLKASRRWQEKNKEQMKHVRNRSGAKGYIKNASLEELAELEQLITKRKKALLLESE
jgi:ABC-type xylose transport system substrate-binding protein